MNLFKYHEIRYAEKNCNRYQHFGNGFFKPEKGGLNGGFREERSKVYFGKTYETFPDSLLIPPEQHTVSKKLIWEYHSTL